MSFYLKIIGSVLIVLSTTIVGFSLAKGLELRKKFLISFLEFLYNLQVNIRYLSDDIFSLIRKSATNNHMNYFADECDGNFEDYWNLSINKIPLAYRLSEDEYSLLKDFGCGLGTTDVEGQIQHIELYKKLFETQIQKAEFSQKNKSRLYIVMGFFIGAITVLLII